MPATALAAALTAVMLAAPAAEPPPSAPPAPLHFDLSPDAGPNPVPRTHLYRPGDYGYEPAPPGSSTDSPTNAPNPAFLFSVALPEGNYRVTLTLGDRRRAGTTTVKAETRRLMLDRISTRAGQTVTRSFLVNIRTPALPPPPANAPGGDSVRLTAQDRADLGWDEKLTLEFLGTPRVRAIDIAPVADAPTLYLAGDSTVTDQPTEPAASWGQMLPALLDDRVVIANHAKSGETLKSFLTGLRFDKLLSTMRPGDWLFLQFGHNDQKQQWPQTYASADLTYPAYLAAYIAEARRRGAHPVLVTSPERRNFDPQGRIRPSLTDYAAAVRTLAAREGVPLIDLNADSIALYEALGPDRAPLAFNDGGADRTHHNNYGAWLLANAVASGIRRHIPALAAHVTAPPLDPKHPPLPDQVRIAPSLAHSTHRPAGN